MREHFNFDISENSLYGKEGKNCFFKGNTQRKMPTILVHDMRLRNFRKIHERNFCLQITKKIKESLHTKSVVLLTIRRKEKGLKIYVAKKDHMSLF